MALAGQKRLPGIIRLRRGQVAVSPRSFSSARPWYQQDVGHSNSTEQASVSQDSAADVWSNSRTNQRPKLNSLPPNPNNARAQRTVPQRKEPTGVSASTRKDGRHDPERTAATLSDVNSKPKSPEIARAMIREQNMKRSTNPSNGVKNRQPVDENLIGVFIDNLPRQFSPILLRDLCTCTSCLDASTKQKLFSTADIPSNIKARAVAQDADGISVLWDNDVAGYDQDHATVLDVQTLGAMAQTGIGPGVASDSYHPGRQIIWDAEKYRALADIDYEAYMQDESTLFRALQQLHRYGMLFLTNVPEDEKSVSTIAERIGPVKNTFYGYTWDVRSVPEAKNVAYTSQDLGFHMDLLYMRQPPHLQFLHCIRSSAAGGASLFADSYRAAADLFDRDVSAFLSLATSATNFQYNHPASHLYQQEHSTIFMEPPGTFNTFMNFARAYQRMTNGRDQSTSDARSAAREYEALKSRKKRIEDYIKNVAWSPPFQAPFKLSQWHLNNAEDRSDGLNQKARTWHQAAKVFNQLIHQESGMYERMMGPGECVIFDNRRVLHARRAFEVGDAGKERWLRGAYLDWDPYWSKMRVLGRQYGHEGSQVDSNSDDSLASDGSRGPWGLHEHES